jgi:hypothetical protein
VGVTAVALAAALAAGGIVASYDRLVAKPSRYGAWWDVVVGQYSERAPLDAGIAKLRTNPAVVAAAGYADQPDLAKIDGRSTRLVAATTYIGHEQPIITSGRAPVAADEIAVGQSMHKHIGDNVRLVTDSRRVHVRVVGIVVINDPITTQSGAGDGAFVTQAGMDRIAGSKGLPQSIAIKLDPHLDRASAIESVRRDFSGSIRSAAPQVDVRNLGLLRAVPWLISALVGILALATLVHALVIILVRNRTNLAVLAALGFTRRQRRGVGVFASVALVITGIAISIPVGLIVGNQIWRGVTRQIGLPSRTEVAWATLVAAPICALALAAFVALVATRRTARMSPSEQLHVE